MVPPDGARAKRLPTLSWDSVVDSSGSPDDTAAPAPVSAATPEPTAGAGAITLTPLELDLARPAEVDEPSAEIPVVFAPMQIDSSAQPSTAAAAPTVPPLPSSLAPAPATVDPPALDEPLAVPRDTTCRHRPRDRRRHLGARSDRIAARRGGCCRSRCAGGSCRSRCAGGSCRSRCAGLIAGRCAPSGDP